MIGSKVIVTTSKRGVFFGTLATDEGANVTLKDARNILHWAADTRGFLGLAANGPAAGSKVGPAVPALALRDITSVSVCTDKAALAIEAAPWI